MLPVYIALFLAPSETNAHARFFCMDPCKSAHIPWDGLCITGIQIDTQTRGTQLLVIRCILTCMFCVCFAQWMNVLLTMAVVNTSVRIPLYHLPVPALMGFL